MNYLFGLRKYSDFLLFFISIILFSFAPWLSLQSSITSFVLKVLYLIFFLSLLISFSVAKFSRKKISKTIPIIFFVIVYLLLGILYAGISAVLSTFVNFGIPLIIVLYFYTVSEMKLSKKMFFILNFEIVLCVLFNCFFSIYSITNFDGNFDVLYISKADYAEYNYLRNGRLRAFGFLNSAVIFSNYLSIFVIYTISYIKKKKYFIMRSILLVIMIFCLYLSGSRTPFFSVFVSFFLLFLFKKRANLIPLLSTLAIGFILLLLTLAEGLDLSSLGRIKQYIEAFNLFFQRPFGWGWGYAGFPKGVVSFDCTILVLLVNFGILGGVILYILFKKFLLQNVYLNFFGCILIVNIFLLSGFVNCIHLGILTLIIELNYLMKISHKKCV